MSDTRSELVLRGVADEVPGARRFVRNALADSRGSLVDDAQLVVSELVANAVLHGKPPIRLRLTQEPTLVRIEVEDAGRAVPVPLMAGADAMTGRDLDLVATLSSAWGVSPGSSGGKIVWAELEAGSSRSKSSPEIDANALLAAWPDDPSSESRFTIELGDVPTSLLLSAKAHIDNVVRELSLASSGATRAGGTQLPPHLAELVHTVVHGFADARLAIKQQAVAAAGEGRAVTHLRLTLPLSAADAGERYLAALDEVDRYARDARLLTLETPPSHRVFRQWYVGALIARLRAVAASAPLPEVVTFPERLAEEVTELAPLRDLAARLEVLQKVTAELTGAGTVEEISDTIVGNATQALDAASARMYLLQANGMLRAVATAGGGAAAARFEEFDPAADLPGGVAFRTGELLVTRNLAELARRFPAVTNVYDEERTLLVAPLTVGDHRLGVLSLSFLGESRVDEATQLAFVTTLADVTAQALERALAARAAAEAAQKLAFLAEASVVLASSLDHRVVLKAIADLVVPRLADWCFVHLLAGDRLDAVAITHFDPDTAAWAREMSKSYPAQLDVPSGPGKVVTTGASELYSDIAPDALDERAVDDVHQASLRRLGMTSGLVVPLAGRSGVIGSLTLIQAESGRHYDQSDVEFAEDLARRAALAVETANAFAEQSGRLAQVVRVAEAAQRAILSPLPPVMGPVALQARYLSAAAEARIGGDLYEVIRRDGSVRLLIGDVRGKGLEAVRTATVVLGEFRAAVDVDDLAAVARQMDQRVSRYLGDEDFVTAVLLEVHDDGALQVVACGHPGPLLLSGEDQRVLECPPSLPLGLGSAPEVLQSRLAVGDRVLLYTDGVTEARNENRVFVDLTALAAPLHACALEDVLDVLVERLRDAVQSPHFGDDLALVVAEYRGA